MARAAVAGRLRGASEWFAPHTPIIMSTKTDILIKGLRNVTSTAHLEKKLEAVPGVEAVEIDSQNERAIVEHHGADMEKLKVAVMEEGLQPTVA